MTVQEPDQATVQEFAGKMVGVLNGAGVALMTSIGHKTGLFDTMATLPPSTSEQIASATGLQERYVREWLGTMVTGGVVDYDEQRPGARQPPDRRHRAAGARPG